MAITVPAKVSARMTTALKRFQPILSSALARDVNESDTVSIVTDMLGEIFGYDKYHEVTSEHVIRGTYCDLAVTIEGKLRLLIEVKAIGLDLKEKHLRQAINYAANQGLEWVILTNGIAWEIYKLDFGQPINWELACKFDMLQLTAKSAGTVDCLYLVSREGLMKGALPDHFIQKQATSRHVLGALVLSEPVVKTVRRELKKISPDIKVSVEQIQAVLEHEVLKREVVEGEKAAEAKKKIAKAMGKATKASKEEKLADLVVTATADPPVAIPQADDSAVTEEP